MTTEEKKEGAIEVGKKGKNIISREDKGTFIIEKRKVMRNGMKAEIIYDLKLPKSLKAGAELYGDAAYNALAIASLRTENDDAIEASGKPASESKAIVAGFKSASAETQEKIRKLLMGESESKKK